MKISEAIGHLCHIMADHGDLEMYIVVLDDDIAVSEIFYDQGVGLTGAFIAPDQTLDLYGVEREHE